MDVCMQYCLVVSTDWPCSYVVGTVIGISSDLMAIKKAVEHSTSGLACCHALVPIESGKVHEGHKGEGHTCTTVEFCSPIVSRRMDSLGRQAALIPHSGSTMAGLFLIGDVIVVKCVQGPSH